MLEGNTIVQYYEEEYENAAAPPKMLTIKKWSEKHALTWKIF